MKAISLISGGIDSELATRIILQQGIEVVGLNFTTPFCQCSRKGGCRNEARRVAESLSIEVKVISLVEEYFEILKNPKYGYGKNLNPCIDCRILMLKKAKEVMSEVGASFIVTGEVLGQRPKSQNIKSLSIIEKEAGLEGYIVRPLSAKILEASIPQKEGWIKTENLLDIIGRSRKKQIELTKIYGMKNYLCAAGGCLLTDKNFAKRMKDLLINKKNLQLYDVNLLKIGRHFRIDKQTKVVIGRNETENNRLLAFNKEDTILLQPLKIPGPVCVGEGIFDQKNLQVSANILATYCDGNDDKVEVLDIKKNKVIIANKLQKSQLQHYRIEEIVNV